MNNPTESGQAITLTGKSGHYYSGKIYTEKDSTSALSEKAIVLLSNSVYTDAGWTHHVNSIYNTERVADELKHFQSRDDISHLILLPYNGNENNVTDKVDDLIRSYLHG
jgi:squalene cyclase